MSTEIVRSESQAPATVAAQAIELTAIQADVLLARRQAVEKVVATVMQEGIHYGPVAPGVPGTMLYKAGMEILAASFQLALEYDVQNERSEDGGRRYIATARVIHQPSGAFLGSAIGECSTSETKFKWRSCHKNEYAATPADQRRERYTKKGDKYLQVREEVEDKANTAAKMACKRAASDAIQAVLGIRGMFVFADDAGGRPQQRQQRPARQASQQQGAKLLGPQGVKELVAFAGERGIGQETILADLREHRGYKANSLAPLTVPDAEWLMARYAEEFDPATGELAADELPIGEEG